MSVTNAAVLSEPPYITPNVPDEETAVAEAPPPLPDHPAAPDDAVTVTLTYTGSQAEVLRTLALLEGRTPEEIALDHIARGVPLAFTSSLGEDSEAMATLAHAMFDGPSDLATRSGENLFQEGDR
ncbi:hypothetical protein AB0D34_31780 [Streptomyces sp. NPDC048420]|uniref:hypothetical protein n=1 Tax=Streptomyces sp. NPDC048420 TaxID=3155755 RepID=UPI003430ECBD